MRRKQKPVNAVTLLRKVPLFAGLSKDSLKRITSITKSKVFKKGSIIFTENTRGKTIYIVASGRIKIFAEIFPGRKKTFVYLDKGEFFGELALLDKPTRSASAQAVTACELLFIEQKDFYKILKQYAGVSLNLVVVLSHRLREADKEIEYLSFHSILGRIARVIVSMEKKYGVSRQDGRCIDMALDKKDIAELIGTVREVATRALKQLEKCCCIKFSGKKLYVTDLEKLKYIAGIKT